MHSQARSFARLYLLRCRAIVIELDLRRKDLFGKQIGELPKYLFVSYSRLQVFFQMPAILPPAAMFLCNAILHITLFTRLPAIADAASISKGVLGLCLLGSAVGTLLALPIAGAICDRFGPRRVVFPLLCLVACIVPFISVIPFAGFVATFVAYGFLRTLIDLAQNILTIGIEQKTGKKILARSHGFWSARWPPPPLSPWGRRLLCIRL